MCCPPPPPCSRDTCDLVDAGTNREPGKDGLLRKVDLFCFLRSNEELRSE